MQEIRRSFFWLALAWGAAVALLIAHGVVARAQTEAPNAGIEEIVITAQKRSEPLQEVPVSVSALTGDQLDQIGFANAQDIRTFVPNLDMHTNAGGNTGTTVSIRGAITGDGYWQDNEDYLIFNNDIIQAGDYFVADITWRWGVSV